MTHGHTCGPRGSTRRSPTYNSWRAMIERCTYARHPKYAYYGGRGISVHPDWLGRTGFARFLADLGERPDGKTLDRIDPNGHYVPDNCRWATWPEQVWNKRNIRDDLGPVPDECYVTPLTPAPVVVTSAMPF